MVLNAYAEKSPDVVFKVDIQEEIGPGIWRTVKKSFDKAEKEGAKYMVVHMNTYGGLVLYADSLRTLILNSRIPVWAFIDNNAASAGALIAIACDKIYMREGASIGAATVVNQSGEAMPDKYQSYMRSMIRSTAQAHGADTIINGRDTVLRWKRDPFIAEAMVDESIYIKGVTDTGKIVTFTPHEAIVYGFCDGIAVDVDDVLKQEDVTNYTILDYTPTTLDKIISFLIHPMVQGIFIMLIIGGIYFELQTPGVGFPLLVAITGCVLYFAPLYLEGLAAYWEIILFVVGIILLLVEIFALPGFGIAGILGVACVVASLVTAGVDDISIEFPIYFFVALLRSLLIVFSGAIVALVLSIWLGGRFVTSKKLAIALHAEERREDGYVGVDMSASEEINKLGVALTDLRPSGKIMIGNEIYDAVTEQGDFILKDTTVKVVRHQSGQLYVTVFHS
ncbi:nodulation protein NfeD [Odoribacter sp. OttesenSCG-928-J03]|nr:nodulation protein NfeD [Odoribacter sp. OttesenSCG-928-J03]MDL2283109.1 nodulation protein NfeD [Odoribacter sp. OttesenSCG-928-G04]